MKTAILILMLEASVAAGQEVINPMTVSCSELTNHCLFTAATNDLTKPQSNIEKAAALRDYSQRLRKMGYLMASFDALAQSVDYRLATTGTASQCMMVSSNVSASSLMPIPDKPATIRKWAADGSICAVLGHAWQDPLPNLYVGGGGRCRTCFVCKIMETNAPTESTPWKVPPEWLVPNYTNTLILLDHMPEHPVKGQAYKWGHDPNTHTYLGGGIWGSTLLHWSE